MKNTSSGHHIPWQLAAEATESTNSGRVPGSRYLLGMDIKLRCFDSMIADLAFGSPMPDADMLKSLDFVEHILVRKVDAAQEANSKMQRKSKRDPMQALSQQLCSR